MKSTTKFVIFVLTFLALAHTARAESPREQLSQMVVQLQEKPDDNALRERIIKLAVTLRPAPEIPEYANRAFVKGNVFQKDAKDTSGYDLAIASYREALRVAPWWGDAYFNLGIALETAGKFNEAIASIRNYMASVPPGSAEAREAQNRIYALEAKSELASRQIDLQQVAADTQTGRFVGTWSRSVLGGDREYHRQWFTLSRDGAGLSISGMMTEVGKPPYDIVARGDELEFKVPYTWIMPDGSRPVLAVGVVVFNLSADGRSMTSRQTLLPYTPSQQKHWDNWGEPGEAYGRTPWTKN